MPGLITEFLGEGLAASRPATPDIPSGAIGFYYSTDTNEMSSYADGAWIEDVFGGGGASTLDGLSDVDTTGVADGDVLTYDSAGSEWIPAAPSGGGSGGREVNIGTMRPLSDFTQIKIDGTTGGGNRTATDTSGKAITIKEAAIDTTLRVVGITRNMPSAPARVAAFVQANGALLRYGCVAFGFSDGTKFHTLCLETDQLEEQKWTTSTSRASASPISSAAPARFAGASTGFWIGMRVEGTKAYFEYSTDGVNFTTLKAVTMSTDHLGASGYTKAFVGLFAYQVDAMTADAALAQTSVSILDWDEGGLSRSFA